MIKATANLGSSISVTAQLKSVQTGSCADATYTNSDGSYAGSIASGDNLPIPDTGIHSSSSNYNDSVSSADPAGYEISDVVWTDSDGSPMVTEFGQPIICTAAAGATLTIGVFSDAGLTNPITSADFNDSFFIHLTTDLDTPTTYRFFVGTAADAITITEQAGATLEWTVSSFNDLTIFAESENGTIAACALNAFTVTVNADADANAFIAAHNVLSGGTMISAYQEIVQGAYQRLKGSFTTNGSDLWTLIHDNAASRVYPLIPVNGSTVVADAYALDMIHLNQDATYNGMTVTDFATTGVTGSYGKYFLLDKAPSDFDQDSLTLAVYNRSTITAIQSPLGSSETSSHTTNSVLFWPRYSTKAYYQINRNGTNNQTNPDSPGAWVLSRTTSSENSIYKNGSLLAVGSGVSTTPSTKPMMFHSHNKGGTADYSYSGELSFYAQIPGLTAAQAEDLSEIIIWIQTQLGRNV